MKKLLPLLLLVVLSSCGPKNWVGQLTNGAKVPVEFTTAAESIGYVSGDTVLLWQSGTTGQWFIDCDGHALVDSTISGITYYKAALSYNK